MKTIEEFLKALQAAPVYVGGFGKREDVFNEFAKGYDSDIQILYADYENDYYEGAATVIYFRVSTGKYYEAYGSHCSCYGLEGQWEGDEEVVALELLKRVHALGAMYDEFK